MRGLTSGLLGALLAAVALGGGASAGRAEQPPPVITTLADGASQAMLTYEDAGGQVVYVKVPRDWTIASAQADVSGEALAVPQVDQENDAGRYQGTWGVRAQQFRPGLKLLAGVELFLAHTSSKPGDLTVEIWEDDGNGFPSPAILASVTKAVSVGGYRWEEFELPHVELEVGRPYWIVSYVVPLDRMAYPATPSLGDYGYYIGMSLRDEYPDGDSADFLTFRAGPRWEKFPSRNGWDLMFRTLALRQHFPTIPSLDVGDDRDVQWSYPGEFDGTETTSDFASELMEYLSSHRTAVDQNGILVPLAVYSNSPGLIRISNIRVAQKVLPPTAVGTYAPVSPTPTPPAAATPAGAGVPVDPTETPTTVTAVVPASPAASPAAGGAPVPADATAGPTDTPRPVIPSDIPRDAAAPQAQGAGLTLPVLGTYLVALLVLFCLAHTLLEPGVRKEKEG